MSFLKALETPVSSATLAHNICLLHRRVLNSVGASRGRAPFCGPIDLNKGILEKLFVFEELDFVANFFEKLFWHYQLAAYLRAIGVHNFWSLL